MLSLLWFALASMAFGQTAPISLRNSACTSPTGPLVALTIPVSISGITISVPSCASLGPGILLNNAAMRLELDPNAIPKTPVPRQALHTVVLGSLVQPGVTEQFNLAFTPAPGSYIVVSYKSSMLGGDVLDIVPFAGGDQPRAITLTLPAHRPLLATDIVKILYWTLEPPPV